MAGGAFSGRATHYRATVLNIRRNVIANYFGQGWRALMSLAFIPFYIRYLGIEAYGLISIFTILQAMLSVFDMGMRPALSREMSRFTAGAHDAQSIRDLLRSVEIVGVAIACMVAVGLWLAAPSLASGWLEVETIPLDIVTQAFAAMAAVIALRFVENIYVSSLVGLQRQVLENVLSSLMATMRDVGSLAVLIWVSPTLGSFFIWQGLVALLATLVFAVAAYRALPRAPRPGRYSASALRSIGHFAAGMTAIAFLGLLLTQLDKILVARLLPLKEFTYYALASVVAGALHMLAAPITAAFSPRLIELATRRDQALLRDIYHQGAQMITVCMGAAAVFLIVFGEKVLLLWTANPVLTEQVTPLLRILAFGTMLNGLMWIPYQMQLAHGWTTLGVKINAAAVMLLVPVLFWIVPEYGAEGAAWVWVTLNAGYLVFTIYFMHLRLMSAEKWRWYTEDVAVPLVAAWAAAWLCCYLFPSTDNRVTELLLLLAALVFVVGVTAMAVARVRQQVTASLRRTIKWDHTDVR